MAATVREGFSERFKQALAEAGHAQTRQQELGRMFGVTPQAVRKWLAGEAMPNTERAPRVAEVLGVRKAWLIDNEGPVRPNAVRMAEAGLAYAVEPDALSISGDEYLLIARFRTLPNSQKEAIKVLLESLQSRGA